MHGWRLRYVFVLLYFFFGCGLQQAQGPGMAPRPVESPYKQRVIACLQASVGNPIEGLKMAQSLLQETDLPPYDKLHALICDGRSRQMTGDTSGASKDATQASAMLEQIPLPDPLRAGALDAVGELLQNVGKVDDALRLYHHAYEIGKDSNLASAQSMSLFDMGILYAQVLGNPSVAEKYFLQAYTIAKQDGHDDPGMAFNLAFSLVENNKYDQASELLTHILTLVGDDPKAQGLRYRVMSCQARILMAHGAYEEARAMLVSAQKGQIELHDIEGEATTLLLLARVQIHAKQFQDALHFLSDAGNMATQVHRAALIAEILHERTQLEKTLGQEQEASATQKQANQVDAAVAKMQSSSVVAEVHSQLADQEMHARNQLLQQQMHQQEKQVSHTRRLLYVVLGALLFVMVLGVSFFLYHRNHSKQLHLLSTTDPLTGLLNRREAVRLLNKGAENLSEIGDKRIAIFLLDADHFKSVNDSYGHDAGDAVLKEISSRIRAQCRPDDLLARWGGEEFLLVAWRVTLAETERIADRLLAAVASKPVRLPNGGADSVQPFGRLLHSAVL